MPSDLGGTRSAFNTVVMFKACCWGLLGAAFDGKRKSADPFKLFSSTNVFCQESIAHLAEVFATHKWDGQSFIQAALN